MKKLPGSHKELRKIFQTAATPSPDELNGEYLVDMLTVWPRFKRFSHRKVIYLEHDKLEGHNVLFHTVWGRFFIEEEVCEEVSQVNVLLINYNREGNSYLIRGIRDQVRCLRKDELYIGRFNYLFFGKLIFLGYFSLEKIT